MRHIMFDAPQSIPAPFRSISRSLLQLQECEELYEHAKTMECEHFADSVLQAMNVRVATDRHELVRIPRTGACIIMANHPLGGVEGLALLSTIAAIRPDVKILANSLLSQIPELHQHMVFVNPFGGSDATHANVRGLREAYEWLRAGSALIVFPAGEVSDFHIPSGRVVDRPWNSMVARIARTTLSTIVPAYVAGRNSLLFYSLGKIHPRLRTLQLAREFVRQRNTTVHLRFGTLITSAGAASYASEQELISDVAQRSYLLKFKDDEQHSSKELRLEHERIAEAVASDILARELQGLRGDRLLCEHGDLRVYHMLAAECPHVLSEIARLRELTFRFAGEGTGKESDSDQFDQWYDHVCMWNTRTQEIVGAYRIGRCDDIVARVGLRGLYTNTLFSYSSKFIRHHSPALELGRSFIRVEYQKSHMPLLLLWRGIGEFLARNPQYRVLFGPVSISNDYTRSSRRLMLNSLMRYHFDRTSARMITSRSPLRNSFFANWDGLMNDYTLRELEDLNPIIRELEPNAKGVPVLLKQYLRLGGKVAAFNVDPGFAHCIDALIVVDLHKTQPHYIQKHAPRLAEKMEATY